MHLLHKIKTVALKLFIFSTILGNNKFSNVIRDIKNKSRKKINFFLTRKLFGICSSAAPTFQPNLLKSFLLFCIFVACQSCRDFTEIAQKATIVPSSWCSGSVSAVVFFQPFAAKTTMCLTHHLFCLCAST